MDKVSCPTWLADTTKRNKHYIEVLKDSKVISTDLEIFYDNRVVSTKTTKSSQLSFLVEKKLKENLNKIIENSGITRKVNSLEQRTERTEQRIDKCEGDIINLSKISKETLNGIANINSQYETLNAKQESINNQMSWFTEANMKKMLIESQTTYLQPRIHQNYPNYDYMGQMRGNLFDYSSSPIITSQVKRQPQNSNTDNGENTKTRPLNSNSNNNNKKSKTNQADQQNHDQRMENTP